MYISGYQNKWSLPSISSPGWRHTCKQISFDMLCLPLRNRGSQIWVCIWIAWKAGFSSDFRAPWQGFWLIGLGWGPQIDIANMLPGDADALWTLVRLLHANYLTWPSRGTREILLEEMLPSHILNGSQLSLKFLPKWKTILNCWQSWMEIWMYLW